MTPDIKEQRNWQTKSGARALSLEDNFEDIFIDEFKKSEYQNYRIRKNPTEFKNIYKDIVLPIEIEQQIYTPDREYKHGIAIDFAIDNVVARKTVYVEIKRQDGWVEDLPPRAGRGNAHERLCKFFTPGLLKALRESGNTPDTSLPFWAVFGGNITRDPKRVREITFWFEKYKGNFFMWRDTSDSASILYHFKKHIKPLVS